jgi:MFS family permease
LRGLLALNLTAAAGGSLVIVNTVVYVRSVFGFGETKVAIALASFGGGSMLAALLLPLLLERYPDRAVMSIGAGGLAAGLTMNAALSFAPAPAQWLVFLALWFLIGVSYSAVLTPSGRLLKRSSHDRDRPAMFAAQFALSHACWLITYPLAGWAGATLGLAWTSLLLAGIAAAGLATALRLWPAGDPSTVVHVHEELPAGHPHVRDAQPTGHGLKHAHPYVIDEFHHHWPNRA